MKRRFLILDCFVDEPACLGVPPFVAPYPRYIYGALLLAGAEPDIIDYKTIQQVRETSYLITESYSMVFIIGGAVVPGRYLGARIGTLAEINRIIINNKNIRFTVGGLIAPLVGETLNSEKAESGIDSVAAVCFSGDSAALRNNFSLRGEAGASLVRLHPWFPNLIAEIETYTGCPRQRHCSFCTEGLAGPPEFRKPDDILREVEALTAAGITRFRLGRQADILQYGTPLNIFVNGFPEPDLSRLEYLFNSLKPMVDDGRISVLNIDNVNPGTIANFPEISASLLEVIARSVTPGDTMALGIESFDPEVVKLNSLKVDPSQALEVIRLINGVGGGRKKGIPVILPGVNLLHGLWGENKDTFKRNYVALKRVLDEGLLLKRINIRQVQPYPGTPLAMNPPVISSAIRNRFLYYRDRIRSEVDRPMLKAVYPEGTLLKECMVMEKREGYSYLKQIASYAITLISAEDLTLKGFSDMMVVGHRERSLMAVPVGRNLNTLTFKSIESVSGIGRGKASEIVMRRPFLRRDDAEFLLESVNDSVKSGLLSGI